MNPVQGLVGMKQRVTAKRLTWLNRIVQNFVDSFNISIRRRVKHNDN